MRTDEISVLLGKTLASVEKNDTEQELLFTLEDGTRYRMHHSQDCCESVYIEDINGDLSNLVGSPILMAEEATSNTDPDDAKDRTPHDDSFTWTFYKLATVKGYVNIRWLGESNGYYSESVDFVQID